MQLEQKLQSLKSQRTQDNVLSHLQKIFTNLLTSSQAQNLIEQFEDLSLQIKTTNTQQSTENREADRSAVNEKIKMLILKQIQENEEEKETGVLGFVPNLMDEFRLWQQVGIGLGEEEIFLIFKSLVKLSQTKNTKQIRLWGKILATQKDYYIAEGVVDGVDDGELQQGTEPRGTGVNKYTYWATNDVLEDWTELPLVTPDQIKTSRQIKYIFSGILEKKIITNPQFFGLEKNLLRAQIARISFATQIIPTGIMKLNEEDPKIVEPIEQDENYKPPTFQQLCSLDNWHHSCENILKEGRLVHNKPEIPEGEDEEQFMKKIEGNDPFEPRLKPLSNDKSKEGIISAWNLQVMGDPCFYLTQDLKKSKTNGIIYIRSLIWKGLSIIYQDKFQQSIYIGYGFKADLKTFYPKAPQIMMDEPVEKEDQYEPREKPVEFKQEQVQQDEG